MIKLNSKKNLINNENTTVLITAAGSINSACNYKLAFEEPAFLNIGSTLAIDEIKQKTDFKIFLAVKKIEKFFQLNPFKDIQLIEIGDTPNVIETIRKSLKFINTEWCLINPITTIPSSNQFSNSFLEFGSKKLPKENWASIVYRDEKKPRFFSKKDFNSDGILSYPFTGRILAKTKDLIIEISSLREEQKDDLIYLAENLFFNSNIPIRMTEWLDIGHLATYPLTRIGSIKSRFFNNLIFNEEKNLIKKQSDKAIKIEQEIKFYRNIPNEIKRFFPIILNVKNEKSVTSYEMEYIGNPNLSEIYLFSKLGPNAILRIFNSLEMVFKVFYNKENIFSLENANWLYSLKTKQRQLKLEKILAKDDYKFMKQIYFNDFRFNNILFPSLNKTYSKLIIELQKFENNRPLHFGHGDLCFNNILVDPLFGSVKLIDPKAEKHKIFDRHGIIDGYYDLSKLNHSIQGLYDSVVNNLYKLSIVDINNISLEVYKPKEYEIYNDFFKEIILDKRIKYEVLKLLTANLFLTMLPFHIEDKNRVIVLALLGSVFMSKYSIDEIIF